MLLRFLFNKKLFFAGMLLSQLGDVSKHFTDKKLKINEVSTNMKYNILFVNRKKIYNRN